MNLFVFMLVFLFFFSFLFQRDCFPFCHSLGLYNPSRYICLNICTSCYIYNLTNVLMI
ncbi:hypothetical protein ACP275_05G082800 [Erythranthe tilingii]